MLTYKKPNPLLKTLSIFILIALVGCTGQELPPVDPYDNVSTDTLTVDVTPASSVDFVTDLSFAATDAKYFDLINNTFTLTPEELSLLDQNGFFVSDRLAYTDFTTAYAYIYWKDLPVLVTTDSILHSIHQTYDDLLIHVETEILLPKLTNLLTETRNQIQMAARTNTDPNLNPIYDDLEIYFTVPLILLSKDDETEYDTPGTDPYVKFAEAADSIVSVEFFNTSTKVDFTQFKPRGHYTRSEDLKRYFRAMNWLALIEFRFVDYSRGGNPELKIEPIVAAVLARDAIEKSEQRSNWDEIDMLLSSLIGRSDNINLNDLDRFLLDVGINTPSEIINYSNPDQILRLLITNDYGQQRITGQILSGGADNPEPISRPINFMLLGKRFIVDSYLMSNLVYDRLIVNGEKVQRPLPSSLDIMYVLGNDRAVTHLQSELEKYGYDANLAALRVAVNDYEPDFWSSNVYNQWLSLLRKLNINTTANTYPQTIRTAAWSDKMLHTQLASWAQLRHDNLLYGKQSNTGEPLCEYPAGYVEPYPEFYAAVQDYAEFGQTLFNHVNPENLTEDGKITHQMATIYFENLEAIASRLRILAEKELRLEPFNTDEELFLKSIAIRQLEQVDNVCAIVTREKWNGWYIDLFPWQDDNPALIADIHTNANTASEFPALLPPSVLHIGTGSVATVVILVDTDESVTAYVGPSYTYFETIEVGYPPTRLTDEEWNERLQDDPRPLPPIWTSSFRIPSSIAPDYLELP